MNSNIKSMKFQNLLFGKKKQKGFTFIILLCAMFILALTVQQVTFVISQKIQRERETLLLKIGVAYLEGLQSYYDNSPGSKKVFPKDLNDLLLDKRHVQTKRHIRMLYSDPMTGKNNWTILRNTNGEIVGIVSSSNKNSIRFGSYVIKKKQFNLGYQYSNWMFRLEKKDGI